MIRNPKPSAHWRSSFYTFSYSRLASLTACLAFSSTSNRHECCCEVQYLSERSGSRARTMPLTAISSVKSSLQRSNEFSRLWCLKTKDSSRSEVYTGIKSWIVKSRTSARSVSQFVSSAACLRSSEVKRSAKLNNCFSNRFKNAGSYFLCSNTSAYEAITTALNLGCTSYRYESLPIAIRQNRFPRIVV